jgi:hypothetical protein
MTQVFQVELSGLVRTPQVLFAQQNAFDHNTGWGGAGWAPNGGYYVGGECGQESTGLYWTCFDGTSPIMSNRP